MKRGRVPIEPIERLWARSETQDRGYETPCLIWLGTLKPGGYGQIRTGVRGQDRRLTHCHHVSWEYFYGPIPEGMQIDHLCRQRDCHEIAHLELVTPQENTHRGLRARGIWSC